MPHRLLEITVRPNWEAIGREQAAAAARLWQGAHIAASAAVVISALLATLAPDWPGLVMTRLTLYSLVSWGPPLWFLAAGDKRNMRPGRAALTLAAGLALVAVATVVAVATSPAGLLPAGPFRQSYQLPLPAAALVPAVTWALLLRRGRRARPAARSLGWVLGDPFYYALAGAAAGIALGFHMLLAAAALPDTVTPPLAAALQRISLPGLAWLACYVAGLRAAGEELLLRGLGYHLLAAGDRRLPAVIARITALNLLLGLIPLAGPARLEIWGLNLAYLTLMSVAATLLRYRSGSLVPALACNAAFTLFIAAALPW